MRVIVHSVAANEVMELNSWVIVHVVTCKWGWSSWRSYEVIHVSSWYCCSL